MNIISNAKLNILYKKIKEEISKSYKESLEFNYKSGFFVISIELILWIDYLIRISKLRVEDLDKLQTTIIDSSGNPVFVENLEQFRHEITEIYHTSNNQYLNDISKLKTDYISGNLND